MRYVVALILMVAVACIAFGETPDPYPVTADPAPVAAYTWRSTSTEPDEVYLYDGTAQVGGWSYTRKHYRQYDAGQDHWHPAQAASPVPPPARQTEVADAVPFGLGIGARDAPLASTPWRGSTGTTPIRTFAGNAGRRGNTDVFIRA